MDTIKKAYDDDLVASGIIRYEDFKTALEDGKEKCLERLKIDLKRRSLDDIHDSMSWWACFNKESQFFSAPDGLKNNTHPTNFDQFTHKSQKKKHKAKKKKRKQAKASKRKNRR